MIWIAFGRLLDTLQKTNWLKAAASLAQGFPDAFRFHGNVHNKHRQIGNAVPVPLAQALGRQLRAALEATAHAHAQALLAAQLGD